MISLVTVLPPTLLCQIAPALAQQKAPIRATFSCPAGATLAVEFVTAEPNAVAIVRPPTGPAVTLPIQISGSGYRYADATHELRGKGGDVTWTAGSAPPLHCSDAGSPAK
jgi:membrane-bound inhibitor of C-type lysozyme